MAYEVLDVSKYNPIEDYTKAMNSVDGVLIRIGYRGYGSDGTLVTDSLFVDHYNGFKSAKDAGNNKKIGFYWFTQAITSNEAVEEAEYVYSLIKNYDVDFPIYIDSEYSNTDHDGRADSLSQIDRTTYVIAFCDKMIELGYNAGVYASDSWFGSQLNFGMLSAKTKYSFWVAKYSTQPSIVTSYDAWQYTSSGTIEGYSGDVDLSHFYVDVAEWEEKIDISSATITLDNNTVTFYGDENCPNPTVKIESTTLAKGTDYTVSYKDNINAGTGKVIIIAKGKYIGTKESSFTIESKSISEASITCGEPDNTNCYDINNLSITYGDLSFVENTDYTIEKTNGTNNNYNIIIIEITGKNNFKDSISKSFNISVIPAEEKTDINSLSFNIISSSFTYDGTEKKLIVSIKQDTQTLVENTDYTIAYTNNINAGEASASITGIGKFEGAKIINYTISRLNLSENGRITCGDPNDEGFYDISNLQVSVGVKTLIKDTDYTCTIFVDTSGIYIEDVVTINGIGNYVDTLRETYKVNKNTIDIASLGITLDKNSYQYNGTIIIPMINTDLKLDEDYTVSIPESINVGIYTITMIGIGNYSGTVNLEYTINPNSIETANIEFGSPDINNCYSIENIQVILDNIVLAKFIDYNYQVIDSKDDENGYISTTLNVYGIGNYCGSQIITVTTDRKDIYKGKKVKLEKAKLYPRYCLNTTNIRKSGTYYLWDETVVNDKIRITDSLNGIGLPGYITGWISTLDLQSKEGLTIGDQVIVNGLINTYADGSGNSIVKRNSVMYIVDQLDAKEFEYPYAVASDITREKQGWASESILRKDNI